MVNNFEDKLNIDIEYAEKTLIELRKALEREKKENIELAAIATYLQNIYKAIEHILKLLLKNKNIVIPRTEQWHSELVSKSIENGLISYDMGIKIKQYMKFRHRHIHGYGIDLDEELLMPLSDEIFNVWRDFLSEIKEKL